MPVPIGSNGRAPPYPGIASAASEVAPHAGSAPSRAGAAASGQAAAAGICPRASAPKAPKASGVRAAAASGRAPSPPQRPAVSPIKGIAEAPAPQAGAIEATPAATGAAAAVDPIVAAVPPTTAASAATGARRPARPVIAVDARPVRADPAIIPPIIGRANAILNSYTTTDTDPTEPVPDWDDGYPTLSLTIRR
ncbi:MAG: hypothetical protein JW395_1589 [Nitrospira sp.]|nr:hypothetical protein [Nitrospira sp.]